MKKLFLVMCTFGFAANLFAQDLIIKINKEKIFCKVVEIGTEEVKFRLLDKPDDPVYGISKRIILEIKLADGTSIKFNDELSNPENYIGMKEHAVKFHFLSPLGNRLTFGYEQMLKPGINIEGKIGIIGAGLSLIPAISTSGIFGKGGIKFLGDKSFRSGNEQYTNLLQGFYFRPDIAYSTFKVTTNYSYYSQSTSINQKNIINYNSAAILLNFGYQVVFAKSFTFDFFAGMGYAYTWDKIISITPSNITWIDSRFNSPFYYSHTTFGNEFPLALTSGFTIGVTF